MGHETEVHCMIRNRYMEREKILKNRAGSLNHVSGEPAQDKIANKLTKVIENLLHNMIIWSLEGL